MVTCARDAALGSPRRPAPADNGGGEPNGRVSGQAGDGDAAPVEPSSDFRSWAPTKLTG
jgi:hypothetical protein